MAKSTEKSAVVAQFDWAAVKEVRPDGDETPLYDVWEWSLWWMKWVRLDRTGSGFVTLDGAQKYARERSDKVAAMLRANSAPPKPIGAA